MADPSLMEERRSDGIIVFGINAYRELCGLHFGGITLASLETIIKCSNQGAKHANKVVQQIRAALEADEKRREIGEVIGFKGYLQTNTFDSFKEDRLLLRLERFHLDGAADIESELAEMKKEQARIKSLGENTAVLIQPVEEMNSDDDEDVLEKSGNQWIPEADNDIEDEPMPIDVDDDSKETSKKNEKKKKNTKEVDKNSSIVDLVSDSEEEETVVLQQIT